MRLLLLGIFVALVSGCPKYGAGPLVDLGGEQGCRFFGYVDLYGSHLLVSCPMGIVERPGPVDLPRGAWARSGCLLTGREADLTPVMTCSEPLSWEAP